MIGMSEGNGHPYSWSAIFNGYNNEAMESCGFPVIPRYLEKQSYPNDLIKGATVSHVWTQDPALSEKIAEAALIDNVVEQPEDMITEVDAILLARDDAKNHFEMAKAFIEAGKPIYIDKPLAHTTFEAKKILELEKYDGQIFTCSALRYASELMPGEGFNKFNCVTAIIPKDWQKYSVHIIEPVIASLGCQGSILKKSIWESGEHVRCFL